MKMIGGCLLVICLWPAMCRAAQVNLATTTCAKYQNEMIGPAAPQPTADPINMVMWLFGYSVAKSGSHYMYGEALAGFGFALDAECKNNPNESLLDALAAVKPDSKNPMDLSTLDCATFSARHVDLARTDAESANTIMMWLFGFAVATSGSHVFDAGAFSAFGPALLAECAQRPQRSLFDALGSVKFSKPKD
jgi:HdeA/HdeB family